MNSIQPLFEVLSIKNIEATCPLTTMPFNDPYILLEDGMTYEKDAIERWLKIKPNRSPIIGEIPSATILPNHALKKGKMICPITGEPFKEAYYCVEDGQTYEKNAIIQWFEGEINKIIQQEIYSKLTIKSPVSAVELIHLTLYPNKALFQKEKIIKKDKPKVIKFDINAILYESFSKQKFQCVFDQKIRDLVCKYSKEKSGKAASSLKQKIHKRRLKLGLNIKENEFKSVDLSHLNLSNMAIRGLLQKSAIFHGTDFSNSLLENCSFLKCRFFKCNLQRVAFINCDFHGEEVSFIKSDMQDAVIDSRCNLEKGSSNQSIRDWEDFKSELSSRGALHVESVSLRKI